MTTDDHRKTWGFGALASLGLALGFAPAALAQTDSALLVKPFPKEMLVQSETGGAWLEQGHTQKSNADFKLGIYGSEGMFRLQPGEIASPRIGYNFTYLDTHTSLS